MSSITSSTSSNTVVSQSTQSNFKKNKGKKPSDQTCFILDDSLALKTKIEDLENRLEVITKDKSQLTERINDLMKNLLLKDETINSLSEQLSTSSEKIKSYEKELENVKQQAQEETTKLVKDLKEHQLLSEENEKKFSDFEKELEFTETQKRISTLKESVSELKSQLEEVLESSLRIIQKGVFPEQYKNEPASYFNQLDNNLKIYIKQRTENSEKYENDLNSLKKMMLMRNDVADDTNFNQLEIQENQELIEFLGIILKCYQRVTGVSNLSKKLQENYDKFVKSDYKNSEKYKQLIDTSTSTEDLKRTENANIAYLKLPESEKKDLLIEEYTNFLNKLNEINSIKAPLEKEIKELSKNIASKIQKSHLPVFTESLSNYEVYSDKVKEYLIQKLNDGAYKLRERYKNFGNWLFPLWNEALHLTKKLDYEITLIKERELFHQIKGSYNDVNTIKGDGKYSEITDTVLQTYKSLWSTLEDQLTLSRTTYLVLIEKYNKAIQSYDDNIKSLQKNGLSEEAPYIVSDFTPKEAVIKDLIKVYTDLKKLTVSQKTTLEAQWSSTVDRVYYTAIDLDNVLNPGFFNWLWAGLPFKFINLYNKLVAPPVTETKGTLIPEAKAT